MAESEYIFGGVAVYLVIFGGVGVFHFQTPVVVVYLILATPQPWITVDNFKNTIGTYTRKKVLVVPRGYKIIIKRTYNKRKLVGHAPVSPTGRYSTTLNALVYLG